MAFFRKNPDAPVTCRCLISVSEDGAVPEPEQGPCKWRGFARLDNKGLSLSDRGGMFTLCAPWDNVLEYGYHTREAYIKAGNRTWTLEQLPHLKAHRFQEKLDHMYHTWKGQRPIVHTP